MTTKLVTDSCVETTQLVLPQHANMLGSIFGGAMMEWIDIAAATAAFKHCRGVAVTASMDSLDFLAPVKVGHIVKLKASVNHTAKSSIEVGVKVFSEDPISEQSTHTASAYLTFVAIDKSGNPTPVPQIVPKTEDEKRRWEMALQRRKIRLERRARHSK